MRKNARFLLPLTLLLLCSTLGGGPLAEERAAPSQKQTLYGEYRWNAGETGDLRAVFTPDGEDRWQVSFHFEFNGQPHVYTGFARGKLSEGELTGEVKTENRRRTFAFSGEFDGRQFRGTHAELKRGREYRTGTLTLAARSTA